MKKLIAFAFVAVANLCFGQKAENLFRGSDVNVYWLGVDFSNVQLAGVTEKNPIEIKTEYFPAWNNLILSEREKYDIKGMLRKENMSYNIDMMKKINATAATEEMETSSPEQFSDADIQKFVKRYKPEKKDGIGIVLIAEALNKFENAGVFHFVAFDLSNNKVLLSERLTGKPKGFGLRNYWAGSIYNIIKTIEDSKYEEWKSKYSGS